MLIAFHAINPIVPFKFILFTLQLHKSISAILHKTFFNVRNKNQKKRKEKRKNNKKKYKKRKKYKEKAEHRKLHLCKSCVVL